MVALTAKDRRREAGHTLTVVAVMVVLAMAVWMLAWRATHDAIRIERFAVLRETRGHRVAEAAARFAAVLRTGRPPEDPYACKVTTDWQGEAKACVVEASSEGDADHWQVAARMATELESSTLDELPPSFAP